MAVRLYALHLPALLPESTYAAMLALVSHARRQRCRQLRQPWDQQRAALGELLVKFALQSVGDGSASRAPWERDGQGKPCLCGRLGWHFNLAHSGRWVGCAVADHPVGVDVQARPCLMPAEAAVALSPEEVRALARQPEEQQQRRFWQTWVLKESYVKALGIGLAMDLRRLEVTWGESPHMVQDGQLQAMALTLFDLDADHLLGVAGGPVLAPPCRVEVAQLLG